MLALRVMKMDIFHQSCMMFGLLSLISFSTYALEPLDDEVLSKSTGQDGITIRIAPAQDITATLAWTDTNGIHTEDGYDMTALGFAANKQGAAGSVVFGQGIASDTFKISKGVTTLKIDADGGVGLNAPLVNVSILLPQDLKINTGSIYVAAKSSAAIDAQQAGEFSYKTKIMSDMQIGLSGLNMNLQLGQPAQGSFLKIYGTVKSGIEISNFALLGGYDQFGEYGMGARRINIRDAGGDDLVFNGTNVNLTSQGLKISTSIDKKIDLRIEDFKLGNLSASQSIGNIALTNLEIGGKTLLISGH